MSDLSELIVQELKSHNRYLSPGAYLRCSCGAEVGPSARRPLSGRTARELHRLHLAHAIEAALTRVQNDSHSDDHYLGVPDCMRCDGSCRD